MRKTILSLIAAAISMSAAALLAQEGPSQRGAGQPSMEQAVQNNLRMLGELRANPDAKRRILERMKERLAARDVPDIDSKMAEIGKIADEAIAMGDASFESAKQQLAARIASAIRGGKASQPASESAKAPSKSAMPWIDVHDHFVGKGDFEGAVKEALSAMDKMGCERMIVMPTPSDGSRPSLDCDAFASALRPYSKRFAFLGGGGKLNSMIQQSAKSSSASAELRRQFEEKAVEILKAGALGFGEMAIHHLSLHGSEHPYESVPGDHPLLLLLADIAARNDVPIDVHFDVADDDIQSPAWLLSGSPGNPKLIPANLPAFERLLSHNEKAKIVWAHAGSDNLGSWTASLSEELLRRHPNLYMSLRLDPGHVPENFPIARDGKVKAEWMSLFEKFPDRFVIGGDNFFMGPAANAGSLGASLSSKTPATRVWTPAFLSSLPQDLARKLAFENAEAIYKLKK